MDRSEVEKISKALADQTRLRIFEAISATDHMNCGEIVSLRGVTPATVSHHLKILSEAGLIACHREGQFVYSESLPETISAYTRALAKMARGKKTARRPSARADCDRAEKLDVCDGGAEGAAGGGHAAYERRRSRAG
jgi:ArsR family transcriptional regulator